MGIQCDNLAKDTQNLFDAKNSAQLTYQPFYKDVLKITLDFPSAFFYFDTRYKLYTNVEEKDTNSELTGLFFPHPRTTALFFKKRN